MLKKFIDAHTVKDVPLNGVITVDIENEKGELTETRTGVSNLPLAFEKDISLANKNGYYEYTEDDAPEFNEDTHYITYHYTFDGKVITKKWTVNSID